jgi:hypothetical protein
MSQHAPADAPAAVKNQVQALVKKALRESAGETLVGIHLFSEGLRRASPSEFADVGPEHRVLNLCRVWAYLVWGAFSRRTRAGCGRARRFRRASGTRSRPRSARTRARR